jgi:hypothetical protein
MKKFGSLKRLSQAANSISDVSENDQGTPVTVVGLTGFGARGPKPKSPPTASAKNTTKKTLATKTQRGKTESVVESDAKEDLKSLALEMLKKLVEKDPNKYPELSKRFGLVSKDAAKPKVKPLKSAQ